MRKNSKNPRVGAAFQRDVADKLRRDKNKEFNLEWKIPIGNPPKDHKFDSVSVDNSKATMPFC